MNFFLNNKNRCLIATPLNHLPSVNKFISERSHLFSLAETAGRLDLIKILKEDKTLKYLFVNPNAQNYLIDKDLINEIEIKGINTCSTGTNHIDIEYCEKKNIKVISLKNDYELINNLPSTAELAFVLMQSLFRNIILCNHQVVNKGIWDYTNVMGYQFSGKTIGCLGYGRLGKIFCQQLSGFNVKIKVCEKGEMNIPESFEKVSIEELFSSCDAIALHIHSSKDNKKLINNKLLSKTKKGFFLVNTSRGDICDEFHISELIRNRHMGGYATDVLSSEFQDINSSPIYKLAKQEIYNILITPHVGGMTFEGQSKAFLYALSKFKIQNY